VKVTYLRGPSNIRCCVKWQWH